MLEKLNTPGMESISVGSPEAVEILTRVKAAAAGPVVAAEVGVGIGASTVQFVRILGPSDELHLFDRTEPVNELISDLEELPEAEGITFVNHSNEPKLYGSYAWELAVWLRELRSAKQSTKVFDFVYLDGAHQFLHDAAAVSVLKQMIKPGGYIVFDDMTWTFNGSPTLNPTIRPETGLNYTEDQLRLPHVALVVDVLMRTDRSFDEIRIDDSPRPIRAVFRRKAKAAVKPKSKSDSKSAPLWRRAASRARRALRSG